MSPVLKYRDPVSGAWTALPNPPAVTAGPDEVVISHQPSPSASGLELWVDLDSGPSGATGVWATYTPTWRSSITIVPGTGGSVSGAWMRLAPYLMAVQFKTVWGSTGGNGGTGQHFVSLPSGFSAAGEQELLAHFWSPNSFGASLGVAQLQSGATEFGLEAVGSGTSVILAPSQSAPVSSPPGWYPNGLCAVNGMVRTNEP